MQKNENKLPEILIVTTFPPRECGIATYSQDLIFALKNKFKKSFALKIVAVELQQEKHLYSEDIFAVLESDNSKSYLELAEIINERTSIEIVLFQHEFGLFKSNEEDFISLLNFIQKPKIVVYHTVLPLPNAKLKRQVQQISKNVDAFIVMTNTSAKILVTDYAILNDKITVIPHGTHLVEHSNKGILKKKYNLSGRKIITTFCLLSSGKCIETSIKALQTIVKVQPEILFLVIGKTHPTVVKNEGETYRNSLETQIIERGLQKNVKFINKYLPLNVLLEYLQLTDIYLFTTKDRNQAVSGTFSYALSCGCPVISTPIPHAIEVLHNGAGVIIDFENPEQLAKQVIILLNNKQLRNKILKGISLFANNGESLVILGRSGSGKSVTIKCLVGLIEADKGEIKIFDTEITNLKEKELNAIRVRIGFMFQNGALYDSMSIKQNLTFTLKHYTPNLSKSAIEKKIIEALDNDGLKESIDKMPAELSGGMKKRIALARALIIKPEIILYDEPTSGLDTITAKEISELMVSVQKKYKTTSIIITHDMACAKITGNRILILKDGIINAEGSYAELENNKDEWVRSFFI